MYVCAYVYYCYKTYLDELVVSTWKQSKLFDVIWIIHCIFMYLRVLYLPVSTMSLTKYIYICSSIFCLYTSGELGMIVYHKTRQMLQHKGGELKDFELVTIWSACLEKAELQSVCLQYLSCTYVYFTSINYHQNTLFGILF